MNLLRKPWCGWLEHFTIFIWCACRAFVCSTDSTVRVLYFILPMIISPTGNLRRPLESHSPAQVICWWHYQRYGAQMLLGDGHRGVPSRWEWLGCLKWSMNDNLGSDWMFRRALPKCNGRGLLAQQGAGFSSRSVLPVVQSLFHYTLISSCGSLCHITFQHFPSCLHLYRLGFSWLKSLWYLFRLRGRGLLGKPNSMVSWWYICSLDILVISRKNMPKHIC